jgi:hypothetical protein
VYAAGQNDAFSWFCASGDDYGHVPVLSGTHLHALKVQMVPPTGL